MVKQKKLFSYNKGMTNLTNTEYEKTQNTLSFPFKSINIVKLLLYIIVLNLLFYNSWINCKFSSSQEYPSLYSN